MFKLNITQFKSVLKYHLDVLCIRFVVRLSHGWSYLFLYKRSWTSLVSTRLLRGWVTGLKCPKCGIPLKEKQYSRISSKFTSNKNIPYEQICLLYKHLIHSARALKFLFLSLKVKISLVIGHLRVSLQCQFCSAKII